MNTKKLIIGSVVVIGVVFTTGCAGKFYKGNFKNYVFERFDKNNDSKLNKKEHFDMTFSRFERMDNNEDLKVTKKELKDSMFVNIKSDFADYYLNKYDLNKDGKVIKSELIEKSKIEFSNLDLNNDGFVSKIEFKKQKSPFKKEGVKND